MLVTRPLPAALDLLDLHRFAPARYPVLLESVASGTAQGRWDLLLASNGESLSLAPDGNTRREDGEVVKGDFLSALDQAPGDNLPEGHPDADKDRLFNIVRAQYSLGPSNYVGALAVDTEFAGGYNRVIGADLSWRVNSTQRVSGFVLGSASRDLRGDARTTGIGAQAGYQYNTRRLNVVGYAEHYDPGQ